MKKRVESDFWNRACQIQELDLDFEALVEEIIAFQLLIDQGNSSRKPDSGRIRYLPCRIPQEKLYL